MFSTRSRFWHTFKPNVYSWPHPLARPAVRWMDKSLYLPWEA